MSEIAALRSNPSFKVLASEVAKGECVIFVGAGLSIAAGLPSWADLEIIMRKAAGLSQAYSAPRVAGCCKAVIGEQKFNVLLRKHVPRDSVPTEGHRCIVGLPVNIFVTTNYDTLLEAALRERQLPHTVLSLSHTSEWMQVGDVPSDRQVLKIHGCIAQTPSKLIITEDDYLRYIEEHRDVMAGLAHILAKRPVLFVGYSLSDWYLLSLLHTVERMTAGNSTNKYYLGVDLELPMQRFLESRYRMTVFQVGRSIAKEQTILEFFDLLVEEFEIPQWLRKVMVELGGNKGPQGLDRNTQLATLFPVFDVVTRMRLALRIEHHEQIQLPMDRVMRGKTLGDLLDLVRERKEVPNASP